ncbi:hypothetical protein [Desertibacillus haloalkaliphilus]|uniref:hypothetical protein n=1 Tax=Desertibacillus haloalkaliphilus TaxID=1328930 RepID=UPI001C278296|nr:hypothetical protein [Desertibacillus haloalkaliphilus]MBU8906108.1 hypothetical protein [Desertibacillus haloalkaliphilus]
MNKKTIKQIKETVNDILATTKKSNISEAETLKQTIVGLTEAIEQLTLVISNGNDQEALQLAKKQLDIVYQQLNNEEKKNDHERPFVQYPFNE